MEKRAVILKQKGDVITRKVNEKAGANAHRLFLNKFADGKIKKNDVGYFLQNFLTPSETVELFPSAASDFEVFLFEYGRQIFSRYHTVETTALATVVHIIGNETPLIGAIDGTVGCNPQVNTLTSRQFKTTLTPYESEFQMQQCWRDFVGTEYYMFTASNLLANAAFVTYFRTLISDMVWREMLRLTWWSDYTPSAFTPNDPNIAPLAFPAYFTSTRDGLWKKIEADAAIPRVTIAENAGLTYAAQKVAPQDAYDYLWAAVALAPNRLKSTRGMEIHVSNDLYLSLVEFAQTPTNFNSGAINYSIDVFTGLENMFFNGYRVINRIDWSETIDTFFDNGTRKDNPNRLLIYEKPNIRVGYNDEVLRNSSFSEPDYDKVTQNLIARGTILLDAAYLRSDEMVKGY